MELQTLASPVATRASAPSSFALLAQMTSRELADLFAQAPSSGLDQLRGHPRGRMLAVPTYDRGAVAGLLRWYAASSLIAWQGKSFVSAPGSQTGRGFNRVGLIRLRAAFPFRTFETASVVDGKPALAISYDLPENTARARSTYDELRHLGDGLYLGRGMRILAAGEAKLLVWFALDTRQQDPDVGGGDVA